MGWQYYDTDGKLQKWHPPTAHDVARALAERDAGRLRYCHDAQAWFVWEGTSWRRDRIGRVLHRVRDLAHALGTDPGQRTSGTTGARAFVSAAETFARSDPALAVTGEVWDADPLRLGTPGGTIDLRVRPDGAASDLLPADLLPADLLPADPADGLTRITAVTPAATADCPRWLAFLDETFEGDADVIGFVQRFCGYALTGSTREHVVMVGLGTGRNGKSVFLNTIMGVMGDYAQPAAPATLLSMDMTRQSAAQAACRAVRLVGVAENDGTWTLRQLKLLTGGDLLPCASGATPAACKLIVMCNAPPSLPHFDTGIGRRLCVIPFRHRPERWDADLETKLKPEWPGILRWAIDGCHHWQEAGLGRPTVVSDATIDMMLDQDPIGQFLIECCDCTPSDQSRSETSAALFAAWRRWAEAYSEPVGSQRAFAAALAERGFARDRTAFERRYRGLRLLDG